MAWFQKLSAAIFGRRSVPKPPCWRCDGHGQIEIYSTSDEYAAPCPVCKGPAKYHARIERKEGFLPVELTWTPAQEATDRLAYLYNGASA